MRDFAVVTRLRVTVGAEHYFASGGKQHCRGLGKCRLSAQFCSNLAICEVYELRNAASRIATKNVIPSSEHLLVTFETPSLRPPWKGTEGARYVSEQAVLPGNVHWINRN